MTSNKTRVNEKVYLILCVGELGSDWGGRVDHVKAFYPRQLVLSGFKRILSNSYIVILKELCYLNSSSFCFRPATLLILGRFLITS